MINSVILTINLSVCVEWIAVCFLVWCWILIRKINPTFKNSCDAHCIYHYFYRQLTDSLTKFARNAPVEQARSQK